MEIENAPVVLPGDVVQAIDDLDLPTSQQISHLFRLSADALRAYRDRFTALFERFSQLEPDVKK